MKKMNLEKSKYLDIYKTDGTLGSSYIGRHGHGYGDGLWGEGILDYIKTKNIKSLIDIGCGQGRFVNIVAEYIPKVYGCDIASVATNKVIPNDKITYLDGEAKSIPLPDKAVECLTSFDCLEHCLPEDIDAIIKEFDRVSTKYYIFSISYVHDSHDGIPLHMTVQPEEWWVDKLKVLGKVSFVSKIVGLDQPYFVIEKEIKNVK